MARLSLVIPHEKVDHVLDAIAWTYGWQETISHPVTGQTRPNPVSKLDLAMQVVKDFFENIVRQYEETLATREAEHEAEK